MNRTIPNAGTGIPSVYKTTAPTTSDVAYAVPTIWLDETANNAYILTDVTAGVATWKYFTVPNPMLFKGAIAVAGDFPTTAAVQTGWMYRVTANVTDNDATKTNTGQSFIAGDEIAWNGVNWSELGSTDIWQETAGAITAVTGTSLQIATVLATTFDTNVAAAGVTLSGTTLAADGTDANIDINLMPKGTGAIEVGSTTEGHNINVNATLEASIAPALEAANWTATDGWSAGSGVLTKIAGTGTGTATPSGTFTIVAGKTYKVTIVCSAVSGSLTYTLGGVTGTTITATTITDHITANTTAKIIFSGGASVTASITSLTVEELRDNTGDVTIDGNLVVRSGFRTESSSYSGWKSFPYEGMLFYNEGSLIYTPYRAATGYHNFGYAINASSYYFGASVDLRLERDAANTLAQRNSTNQQVKRIYNTYTDASNYERLTLTGVQGASVNLTAETAGTGADNLNIVLTPAGTGSVVIPTIDVDAGSIDGTLMGATKTNVQKGPAAITTATTPAVTGTVTAAASTTVTFSSAADAILAGYSATNPILGTTLVSNALTRYIVSWTNATTCVVDSAVTWAGTAITSVQLPISSEVTSASPGVLKRATLADGTEYFVGNVGIGTTTPQNNLHINDTNSGTIRLSKTGNSGWATIVGDNWLRFSTGVGGVVTQNMALSQSGGLSLGSSYVGTDAGAGNMIISGNVGIGTTTFGTSAAKVLAMGEGTAATTVITDGIQFWSANRDGVAGDNRLHIMGEKTTATVIVGDGQVEFNLPANLKGTGIVVYRQAGENLVYKDSCYIKTDGKMWKTDADSYTTMPTTRIALETISADAWGLFLEYGYMRDDTWTWTIGGTIYADTTTGAWTQTAPSGSSDVLQIIGIAESATVAKINPSWVTTEIGLDIEDKSSAGYAITWAELTSVPKTFICDSADPKGFTFASAPTAADIGKSVRIVKSLAGVGTVTVTAPAATYIDDSSAAGTIACPGSARASITLQVISATQIAIVAAVGTWTTA